MIHWSVNFVKKLTNVMFWLIKVHFSLIKVQKSFVGLK
jgi:hypothetical protein